MRIILGFLIITFGFVISLKELNQTPKQYWDIVAFAMVFFGTFSVSIVTSPSLTIWEVFRLAFRGIVAPSGKRKKAIDKTLKFLKEGSIPSKVSGIEDKIITDGVELLGLGYDHEKVREVLTIRINNYLADFSSVGNWMRGLSKYPPAFGLAGTVLGLIHMMKGLSEGSDPRDTGLKMAIALVATFYGILVANILVNPIGDKIISSVKEDEKLANLMLEIIISYAKGEDSITALERVNNFLPNQFEPLKVEEVLMEKTA